MGSEDEWLLGPGSEFKIGDIYSDIRMDSKSKKKVNVDDSKQKEDNNEKLLSEEKRLEKNLVYIIKLYKKPMP